jgi:thioredoxin 1
MTPELLIRFAWTVGIVAAGLLLYRLVSYLMVSRVQAKAKARPLALVHPGTPAILYFTSPDCAPCRTIQRPALVSVQNRMGDRLQVIEINTYEQPELAKEWGVLSLPTTFIIDADGKPRHVNHGVTLAAKLIEQVEKFTFCDGDGI